MSLFDFLEHFDLKTHITIICSGCVEYEGIIAEITQKVLNGKQVILGSVTGNGGILQIECKKYI